MIVVEYTRQNEGENMNHDILKSIIYEQHEIIKNCKIVSRNYTFEKNGNYCLVGLRRAGKSTLLYGVVQNLIKNGVEWNQIIYINFEDERLSEFNTMDFNDILSVQSELSDKQGYFFFDEIQNVDHWEKFARRLADAKERVYITGSNAMMLSGEIATTLGGRYLTKYITPYSFEEYLRAFDIPHDYKALLQTKNNGKIRSKCIEYMNYGGLPESIHYQIKRDYISSVYQKVLLGDIVTRNNIRNDKAVKVLIKKIAETVCSEVSYTKLFNTIKSIGFKVSKDTIIDYIQYAQESYLLYRIENYYYQFLDKESTPKYYFTDTGILNLFLEDKKSALLENLVANHLVSQYPEEVYYLKSSKTGIDIDFYVPSQNLVIQVAYSIQTEARKREIENLFKLAKLSKDENKYIIVTFEEEETIREDGFEIQVIPLFKYLLNA